MSRIRTTLIGVVAAGLLLMSVGIARADIVHQTDLVASPDTHTINVGQTDATDYWLTAENVNQDGQKGCNASDSTPAVVTISSTPAGVQFSPNPITFTDCEGGNKQTVNISSNVPGDYVIKADVQDSGTGTYDESGATFTLHVVAPDTTPPVINVPADITKDATSPSGAVVNFTVTANDAKDGNVPVTCVPTSGSTFPIGDTTVVCKAKDAAGNEATASFKVTVTAPHVDEAPVITASDITEEATGPTTPVTFNATASDPEDGDLTSSITYEDNGPFSVGVHNVTASVTDSAGHTVTKTFKVTITDTTPPDITVPADITAEAQGPGGANVTYSGVSATDKVDGSITPTCGPASGDLFPLGETTVSCSATDNAGNSATKTFKVKVVDTTAPVLSLPTGGVKVYGWNGFFQPIDNGDVVNKAKAGQSIPVKFSLTSSSRVVTYTATAFDLVSLNVPVTCTPPSGSSFPLGNTTVNCSATDAAGNTANGSFTVTVAGGNQGLNIMASGFPTFVQGSVPPADTTDDVELYASSVPGLTYDATADQYVYVWKTDKSWAGKTGTLKVKLADGSIHTAMFNFTK